MIAELNTKLKSVDRNLEDANKREILHVLNIVTVITYNYTVTVLVMRERLISSLLSEEHRMENELKEKKEEDWRPDDGTKTLSSFLCTGQWRGQREHCCWPDDFHWTKCSFHSYFITSLSTR